MILRYKIFTLFLFLTIIGYSQNGNPDVYKKLNETIAFEKVGEVPYPNECKMYKGDNLKLKQCLSDYLADLISKKIKFAKVTNHPPGKYRITVNFRINAKGKADNITAIADYPDMEREAIRVISKLPRMNPGKFEGKEIGVIYGLPINFVIPEKTTKKK